VVYVSYDGVGEPLGRSQVLAYLRRLASSYAITLISFEKPDAQIPQLRAELIEARIDWVPLRYHRRPPVLSTVLDIIAGRRALLAASRSSKPAVVHVRSYVPALIALTSARVTSAKLLFDIRGFWADERVEGGLWRAGGLLYRIAKQCERRFFARADAVVTLTHASVPQIRAWTAPRSVPIDVIPTCVDLDRFGARPPRPGGPHAVWSGSIGTWYRFDLVSGLARALRLPLTVVTRQTSAAREVLDGYPADVRSVAPENVPDELFAGDVGLCLIASTFSKIASAPTRFAEYLAAGMPVIVTPGVGDLAEIVRSRGVGVVLADEDPVSAEAAAAGILALAADHEARERCRSAARELFDVEQGSARYAAIYEHLITR
jgi:glycosyltransferase involved in cell wall biosynthesis